MKLYNKLILGTGLLLIGLSSCKNEDPFTLNIPEGEGRILTSAVSVEVKAEEMTTRTVSVPEPEEFTVAFCKAEDTTTAVVSYQYSDMPEVVTLKAGDYIVKAYYGDDNIEAAFDAPAYYGQSEVFTVENGKILDLTAPIVCSLYNVRVAISFDPELAAVMGEDAKVTVKVGESGTLDFDLNTEKDGFFKYYEESNTLAATFHGTVQGSEITESKNYDKVKRGTYYRITFRLHNIDTGADDPGNMSGGEAGSLLVDASVTFHDSSSDGGVDIDPEKEEYLEDDRYPNTGNEPETPDPGESDENNNTAKPVLTSDDVDINSVTDISEWEKGRSLVVKILTPTKISQFKCKIDSSTLDENELAQVGLPADLDLVNDIYEKEPGSEISEVWQKLKDLGFPVGSEVTAPTEKDGDNYVILFDISQFHYLLSQLGEGTHNFIFTVTNEAGTTTQTLKLKS